MSDIIDQFKDFVAPIFKTSFSAVRVVILFMLTCLNSLCLLLLMKAVLLLRAKPSYCSHPKFLSSDVLSIPINPPN